MYRSGISILDCIKRSEDVVGNRVIQEGMRHVGRQIEDGWSISDSFESAGLFPPLVLRMIKVGETTGEGALSPGADGSGTSDGVRNIAQSAGWFVGTTLLHAM